MILFLFVKYKYIENSYEIKYKVLIIYVMLLRVYYINDKIGLNWYIKKESVFGFLSDMKVLFWEK